MRNYIITFIFTIAFFSGPAAKAAQSPIAFSFVPPIQFPSSEVSVTGARFSVLWGHHRDLYGLDLGVLGNVTDQAFTGLAVSGLFNITQGNTTILGLQLAGLTNINTNKTTIIGLQAALGVNVNKASSTLVGLQVAPINVSAFTDVYGMQIGLWNEALSVRGLQIGIVNRTKSLRGLQIGLANINETGLFYVAPILNVGW